MSKIYYEKRDFGFECVGVANDGADTLRFIFNTPIDGRLIIGDRISEKISGGVSTVKLSQIPEGECKPSVYKSGKHYKLESIIIGKGVSRKAPSDEYIRSLGKEIFLLKERLSSLDKEIKALQSAIKGNPII